MSPREIRACARCGIPRTVRNGRTTRICKECSAVLNKTERKAWAA